MLRECLLLAAVLCPPCNPSSAGGAWLSVVMNRWSKLLLQLLWRCHLAQQLRLACQQLL